MGTTLVEVRLFVYLPKIIFLLYPIVQLNVKIHHWLLKRVHSSILDLFWRKIATYQSTWVHSFTMHFQCHYGFWSAGGLWQWAVELRLQSIRNTHFEIPVKDGRCTTIKNLFSCLKMISSPNLHPSVGILQWTICHVVTFSNQCLLNGIRCSNFR